MKFDGRSKNDNTKSYRDTMVKKNLELIRKAIETLKKKGLKINPSTISKMIDHITLGASSITSVGIRKNPVYMKAITDTLIEDGEVVKDCVHTHMTMAEMLKDRFTLVSKIETLRRENKVLRDLIDKTNINTHETILINEQGSIPNEMVLHMVRLLVSSQECFLHEGNLYEESTGMLVATKDILKKIGIEDGYLQ